MMRWPKKNLSRHFRKNMTLPEVLLWQQIKGDNLGYRIRRQASIGPFIIDFYCAHPKVAIEVDGSIHGLQVEYDATRDEWLNSQGILVFRISASWVLKNQYTAGLRVKEFLDEVKNKNPMDIEE
jgi:very-short-patch-repair endonuclease